MKKVFIYILLAAAVFVVVEIGLLVRDLRAAVRQTEQLAGEARGAVSDLRLYAQEQVQRLRDPRNSKAIDAGLQTLAVYNGTGRLINKSLIPRANKVLDRLGDSSASLNEMIQRTDHSINEAMMPEAVQNLQSSDAALKELSKTLSEASGGANAALNDIHRLLSDPSWAASQQEVVGILEDVHGVTSDVDKATDKLPAIAADLEKISKTSQKFAKPLLIARIVSLLSWLVPWLQ